MAAEKGKMTFFEHLSELRGHLFRASIAIGVFAITAFVEKSFIFDTVIFGPRHPDFWTYRMFCKLSHFLNIGDKLCIGGDLHFHIVSLKLTGQFSTHIMVALVSGIIIAFPYILYEFWRFLKPALHEKERKMAKSFVFFGSVLFMIGVVFGYYVVAPLTVEFLGNYYVSPLVHNYISINSYISTVAMVVLACAILFELPMLVYLLARIGILSSALMKTYRRHSIVAILVIAAVITPPNVASQVLVAIPLLGLYELSIFVAKAVEKKRKREEDAAA